MAVEISDVELQEMALHRGLKLVKSRRRKPGTGDYGKFGLTDAAGKALLGIDESGLTASATDIQDYLRTSALGTWKQSAETTPDRPVAPHKPLLTEPTDDEAPVRRRSKRIPAPRGTHPVGEKPAPAARGEERGNRPKPALRLVPKAEPARELERTPEPPPEPKTRVRPATIDDAKALARLLWQLDGISVKPGEISANLVAARKLKGGMVVAERDAVVGCCGWAVVPTVHRGPVGRLTVLVVDRAHRRAGVASVMLAAAEKALAKAGCDRIEVMSDIAINNSHGFFRSLQFEQVSYRFVRGIGP
ncbi:hypothetical protein ACFB49_26830 [Sphingomonas sp. DBB INV C78]|uniref:GNAT family N-acetyltransferase n=1 Tax=Sphingomonas sp. DBB INV C78 TaxID=3349434 RepID=UPI0036D393FD